MTYFMGELQPLNTLPDTIHINVHLDEQGNVEAFLVICYEMTERQMRDYYHRVVDYSHHVADEEIAYGTFKTVIPDLLDVDHVEFHLY